MPQEKKKQNTQASKEGVSLHLIGGGRVLQSRLQKQVLLERKWPSLHSGPLHMFLPLTFSSAVPTPLPLANTDSSPPVST